MKNTVEYECTARQKSYKHIMICCPFCPKQFIFENSLLNHIGNVHFPSPQKQIQSMTAVNYVKHNLNLLLLLL